MTNADKIRSMTDEELAKFLGFHANCVACEANCLGDEVCEGCQLIWLKQEVSE